MSYTQAIPVDEPLRFTFVPGIHTPLLVHTEPGAICTLRHGDDVHSGPTLKAFAGPDGVARFHVNPSSESPEIGKLLIETVKDGRVRHRPLHIRASFTPDPEMPAPPQEKISLRGPHGRVRVSLSIDDALRLTAEDLMERGYPVRPDPDDAPGAFRAWLRAVSMPMVECAPHLIANEGRSHLKKLRAGNANFTNWSGFELDRTFTFHPRPARMPPTFTVSDPYDWVQGEWHVPTVTGQLGTTTCSTLWVGLDGDGTPDLVQAGTEQDCTMFKFLFFTITTTTYYAWTEFLPQQQNEQVISGLTVNPGDDIFCQVWIGNAGSMPTLSGVFGVFLIMNLTTGSVSTVYTPVGSTPVGGSEAVWIMERPEVGGELPHLSNYGSVVMFNAWARKTTGGFIAYQGARNQQITMVNGSDTLSTVSAISSSSMQFNWSAFS